MTEFADWITPDWPAPANVRALITTRTGGVSLPPYQSMNLGDHVGDDPAAVARNRSILRARLPAEPKWLKQVHSIRVAHADTSHGIAEADASIAHAPAAICAVLTADCLPVLLCDDAGTVVGAAHAGWRGLVAGVIEATADAMEKPPDRLMAYLGPAIGPRSFEVGSEVRQAFMDFDARAEQAFSSHGSGKWLADIYMLARQRLDRLGVSQVFGGGYCTVEDAGRFYSYRRDGVTGRMASLIWLAQ
jgi:YfiH family protein